jgi:hypothetical protein
LAEESPFGKAVCLWDAPDEECFLAPEEFDLWSIIFFALLSAVVAAVPNGILGAFFRRTSETEVSTGDDDPDNAGAPRGSASGRALRRLSGMDMHPERHYVPVKQVQAAGSLGKCAGPSQEVRLRRAMLRSLVDVEAAMQEDRVHHALATSQRLDREASRARVEAAQAPAWLEGRAAASRLTAESNEAEAEYCRVRERARLLPGPRGEQSCADRARELAGVGPRARALRRHRAELAQEDALELELGAALGTVQAVRLQELHWQGEMSGVQRVLFGLNQLKTRAPRPLPGKWCEALVWGFALAYITFMGLFVVLFGMRKGESVSNAWLLAVCLAVGQELLVSSTIQVLILNTLVPRFIVAPVLATLRAGERAAAARGGGGAQAEMARAVAPVAARSERGAAEAEASQALRVRIALALKRDLEVRCAAARQMHEAKFLMGGDEFAELEDGELCEMFGIDKRRWLANADMPAVRAAAPPVAETAVQVTEIRPLPQWGFNVCEI